MSPLRIDAVGEFSAEQHNGCRYRLIKLE